MILFFVSVQFISTSIEYWYNLPIERSLKNSLEVGQDYYNQTTDEILSFGNNLGRLITYHGYMLKLKKDDLEKFISEKRTEYQLASIKVFSQALKLRAVAQDDSLDLSPFKDPPHDLLVESFEKGTDIQNVQTSAHGELISGIIPIFSRTESKAVVGLIVLEKFVQGVFVNRLDTVARGLEEYKQFMMLKRPIKVSYMITLSIVTLLIIFSSVWFGFYLSKGITVPIQELAEGTNRIAAGDYNFFIDLEAQDEIGDLVNSFNRMTLDLKNSKMQLEEANEELIASNVEIEQRRLYMEIVLANIAAGVVSTDAEGRILTINRSAKTMLDIKGEETIGEHYEDVMGTEQVNVINGFLKDKGILRKGFLQKQIMLTVGDRTLTLLVSMNMLRDDQGRNSGLVAVFEDLSEIEKAQRVAAWREVAKRIAHEVKNPLTPIQLSAQRLQKRYKNSFEHDGKVFEECISTIIRQVEEMKNIVNEFSLFARMPAAKPVISNLNEIVHDILSLYRQAHRSIQFEFEQEPGLPSLLLDPDQIRRVLTNLIDNAVDATGGRGGIRITTHHDSFLRIAGLEIADDGCGIPKEMRDRVFEPYASSKKGGTGLGLVIVKTIVADHNGYIRIRDNEPKGTRIFLEFPVPMI